MPAPIVFGAVVKQKQLRQMLKQIGVKAKDLRPVFKGPIATSLSRHMKEQFDTRGAHFGTPWPPLSTTTIKLRTRVVGPSSARRSTSRAGRAKAGFATPMQDSRRLYFTLTRRTDPEAIRVYQPLQMFWGSKLPYAGIHQVEHTTQVFGKGPFVTVPARKTVPDEMPVTIQESWARMIAKHVAPPS